jgi:hypothetical protein
MIEMAHAFTTRKPCMIFTCAHEAAFLPNSRRLGVALSRSLKTHAERVNRLVARVDRLQREDVFAFHPMNQGDEVGRQ